MFHQIFIINGVSQIIIHFSILKFQTEKNVLFFLNYKMTLVRVVTQTTVLEPTSTGKGDDMQWRHADMTV